MKKGDFRINKATLNNVNEILFISEKTFCESYTKYNTAENMRLYLEENITLEKLTDELNNPDSEFYLALKENEVIGYLKINFGTAQNDINDKKSLEIERIYISNEFHGKGFGHSLFNKAVEIAQLHNLDYIWLGVWENNLKAINFYERNGLKAFDKHSFKFGKEIQTDILMKFDLKKKN